MMHGLHMQHPQAWAPPSALGGAGTTREAAGAALPNARKIMALWSAHALMHEASLRARSNS